MVHCVWDEYRTGLSVAYHSQQRYEILVRSVRLFSGDSRSFSRQV